ncbi:MAG: hypothetical protein B7Y36_06705 [Novosphingobium sp. 28-62-57]|nr:MAG: hypothetical protein B7Z34_02315 [Novosphingobium sp. 12-62-10]OYZ11052.1 MAG: hypothetical protein B7Y36_06705 [Novosphingobium sp. 28-62-57]OZA39110.1 MAG: hypothetical protein B7X92_03090 [Novosphingobium sp. 17-62-9]
MLSVLCGCATTPIPPPLSFDKLRMSGRGLLCRAILIAWLPREGGGLRPFTLMFRNNTEAPAFAGERVIYARVSL